MQGWKWDSIGRYATSSEERKMGQNEERRGRFHAFITFSHFHDDGRFSNVIQLLSIGNHYVHYVYVR